MRAGRAVVASVTAALLAIPAAPALACGGMVSPDGSADLQGMSALLSHDGTRESLAVVVSYAARGAEFAWLMPLPAVPEISAPPIQGLREGFRITTPPFEADYQADFGLNGPGAASPAGGARELDRTTIGGLDFATLGATSSAEIATWMRGHGFAFHDNQLGSIQGYLTRHWVIVAARATGSPPTSGAMAVRFSFPTADPVYPLAIAGASHAGSLPMHLLVVTPFRPASSTLAETTVKPASNGVEPPAGSRLELRYAAPMTSAQRDSIAVTVPVPTGAWLTRYDAEWKPSDLTTDLVLKRGADQGKVNFDELYGRFQAERDRSNLVFGLLSFLGVWANLIVLVLVVSGAITVVAGTLLGGFKKTP